MARLVVDGRRMATSGVGTAGPPDYAQVVAYKERRAASALRPARPRAGPAVGSTRAHQGTGTLLDSHTVEISTEDGVEQWRADSVILASGADIVVPPIPGAELCVTSRDFYALEPRITHPPDRLVVISGG